MPKQISQNLFNSVVKENIEDFDMDIGDAIEDARKQFETQNVNLYNIITDSSMYKFENGEVVIGTHKVVTLIDEIKLEDDSTKLHVLLNDINSYFKLELSYRIMACKNDGFSVLENCFKLAYNSKNIELTEKVLVVFNNLILAQPDILTKEFLDFAKSLIHTDALTNKCLANLYKMLNTACIKHEKNREILVDGDDGILAKTMDLLLKYGEEHRELVREICGFCRALILDDDIRVTCGRGTDFARMLVAETNSLVIFSNLCKSYKDKDDEITVSEIFSTLDKLSVRNEFCQRILELGGLKCLLEALENHIKNARLVVSSLGLLKSIAANDQVKMEIAKQEGLELMVRAIQRHIRNSRVCINGCGALAAVTLRQPDNCLELIKCGVVQLLYQCLTIYCTEKNCEILRPACLTIRNIVARCPQLKLDFIESGFEELLNSILQIGREVDDEAKAALRDLGLSVTLRELWTGKTGHITQN